MEVVGEVVVRNLATGECARVRYTPCKGKLEARGVLEGQVLTASGQVAYTLEVRTPGRAGPT